MCVCEGVLTLVGRGEGGCFAGEVGVKVRDVGCVTDLRLEWRRHLQSNVSGAAS